jgi:benzoate-CoA ligase family protein
MPAEDPAPVPHVAAAEAIPRHYNFAADLLGRNRGRADKTAYIDGRGTWTYGELADRVGRFARVLRAHGVLPEQRILICLTDTIDWPTAFLGAIKAGAIAVPVNTLATETEYRFMLTDSRARLLVVSAELYPRFAPLIGACPELAHVMVSGAQGCGHARLDDLLASAAGPDVTAATTRDDLCFWLYTSGSTGEPKGVVHTHAGPRLTADLYGKGVLGLTEHDLVYSVAKLFFAYGLGNALSFPLAAGAATVLLPVRPTPEAVGALLREHPVTVLFAVPTFYAALLASPAAPLSSELSLRCCVSAGEALPAEIGRRFRERYGIDILDGLGSTEMLHIFLSNRPGDVRYGTSGKPVPGYGVRLVGEDGAMAKPGEIGELHVAGPTGAVMYWNNRAQSRATFLGEWTRSGDNYLEDGGYYVYCGRRDDMLKVGGIFVSPFEVESALLGHEAVLEAAVVAWPDENRLIKPKAFVVLKDTASAGEAMAGELKDHCRARLAPFKYPRWIEFRSALPKTATGKIQRFKLRAEAPH